MASAMSLVRTPSPHSDVSEDSGVNSEEDGERIKEKELLLGTLGVDCYENIPFVSTKQIYNFEGSANFSSDCSIQLIGITYKKDEESTYWDDNENVQNSIISGITPEVLYENLTFVTASSKKDDETPLDHPLLAPPLEFADNLQSESCSEFTPPKSEDGSANTGRFANAIWNVHQLEDAESPRTIARCRGGVIRRSCSYKSSKQEAFSEGRQRHYTDGDCIDITKHEDGIREQEKYDKEDSDRYEDDERDLSLTLTTQNPSRIDVKTLRKKKVTKFLVKLCSVGLIYSFFLKELKMSKHSSKHLS